MDDKMLEQLKSSAAIPSLPQVVCRFLDIVRDPVFSYEDLVDVLSTDPGLAGDVLRLANSSFFGVSGRVTGLHQALTMLGIRRVRSLVLGRYMVRNLARKGDRHPHFKDYWRRSVNAAVLTSRFAVKRARELGEEAMIAGLLSDVGVIVLADGLPEDYAPVAEHYLSDSPAEYAAREREALDTDHAEVGAVVLEEWQLPPFIIEAVRHRYTSWASQACSSEQRTLAQLISGAGTVSWLVSGKPEPGSIVRTCIEAAEQVGTDLGTLLEVLDETETDVQDLASLLQLEVLPLASQETVCRELSAYLSSRENAEVPLPSGAAGAAAPDA